MLKILLPYLSIPHNVIFPFYHLIAKKTPAHISALYRAKTPEEFKKDLEMFLKHFKPIDIEELYDLQLKGESASKPSFYLSFDDGLQECYSHIVPILKEYGIPATFFINPNFIDNKDLMYRYKQSLIVENMNSRKINTIEGYTTQDLLSYNLSDAKILHQIAGALDIDFKEYLSENTPYMTLEQVREIHQAGFTIGAHSMSHPLFQNISEKEQINQTKNSIEWVQFHFPTTISLFAFPFTDYGVATSWYESMENRMELCFTTAGIKNDVYSWVYNRFSMEIGTRPLQNQLYKFQIKNTLHFRNVHKHT